MVADAQAIEKQQPFKDVVSDQVGDFRGSFSGYERDRLFYNPNGSDAAFVQSAYIFGLDSDHDGRSTAPVDIDGDGDLDLAVLSAQGLRFLENTSAPRRFARVRVDNAFGTPAVGAVVELLAGGVTRRDFVKITDGFRTQVPSDLHFGLANAENVESLEVRWPSGRVDRWTDLPVDQLLLVRENTADVETQPLPRWPENLRPRLNGTPSPTVEAQRLDGHGRVALNAGNEPTVVNFWAPWCVPCRTELPQLARLADRYAGEAVFAGVNVELDDLDSARAMIDEFSLSYDQFLADSAVMERFFGAGDQAALPSTFVFDQEGHLRRLFRGAITEADLEALLDSFRDEGIAEADLSLAARLAFEAGDYDQAVRHYTRLTHLEPDSLEQVGAAWEHRRAVDQMRLGVARLRAGRPAEAVADFQLALTLLGEDPIVLLRLGIAAADARQLVIAADALERAVRANPTSVDAWLHKARVHQRRNEPNEAKASIDRVLALDPTNRSAQRQLADLAVQPAAR